MQISIQLKGLEDIKRKLDSASKQVNFAASRALNTTAYALNKKLKEEMQEKMQGGATAYTLRAFTVDKATKGKLVASVNLRNDAPEGGTPYSKALGHLFTGGTRDWKKLEGMLRSLGLVPNGHMTVPGQGMPLDRFGNITRASLREMLGVLKSSHSNMRVYRKTGAGKTAKAVGYFVLHPGANGRLLPGVYKRIDSGKASGIVPMILFVKPGKWRQLIDLKKLGAEAVAEVFNEAFNEEFKKALASAQ